MFTKVATRISFVASRPLKPMIATIQPTRLSDAPLHHDIAEEEHEQIPEQRSVETIDNDGRIDDSVERVVEVKQRAGASSATGTLRPLKKIYGRDDEIEIIREEYHRAMNETRSDEEINSKNNKAHLVLVRGASGVGKTSVALSIQDTVRQDGGFVLILKFDHFNTMEVGEGFDEGFEDLCQQILKSPDVTRHTLRETIRASGPVDCATLLEMFPGLKAIIGDKEYAGGHKSVESAGRYTHVLSNFIDCFRKANFPLVILLDDFQFSDTCSCFLLTQIIVSLRSGGVLCLATVGPQQNELLDSLILRNSSKRLRITNIELENIPQDDLNAMVADMLHVTKDISVPMTKFLYHHSRGNPLFSVELLRLMVETGILKYHADQKTWNCEEPQMDMVEHCHDFDWLMRYKLSLAPEELKEMLKMASCFGSKVDARLLEIAMNSSQLCKLKIAISFGWLLVVDEKNEVFQFAHSGVQRGAYGLIPEEERESLHAAIARRLLQNLTGCQRDKYLPMVLGHIKSGSARLEDQEERSAMAGVCLEGAQQALEWSGFVVAFECLELGISLLNENCWREHYDLALALHNNAAECGHTAGDFPRALELVDIVLRNARVFDDKLQAYSTQLYILGSKHDNQTTLQVGVDVLGQLGINVPLDPGPKEVLRETASMLRFMKGKTPERLLRLPTMTDERMASAMQVANLSLTCAYNARPHLATFLVLRAMRITVTHGLCAVSSYIFGLYGAFVCGHLKNVDEGTRYGDAALQLLDRFNAKQWAPRVYVAVYGCVYGWTKDIRYCIEQLHRAQNIGFESGDNQFAILSGNIRVEFMMSMGEPLSLLEKESETYAEETKMLNQTVMSHMQQPYVHFIRALTGDTDSPDPPENVSLDDYLAEESELMRCWREYHMGMVAYFQQNYALAVDLADRSCGIDNFGLKSVDIVTLYMFRALSHVANYRVSGKRKRKVLSIARSYVKQLRVISKGNPCYCLGMMYLLQAEIAEMTEKRHLSGEAHNLYLTAAACFDSENMVMGLAITKELAGRYMIKCGKKDMARTYFEASIELYAKWGALGKRKLLQQEMERASLVKDRSERNVF